MLRRECVAEIVKYVTEVPPEGSDEKRRLKYPQVCHDLLTTTSFIVAEDGAIDADVLGRLLGFLDRDPRATDDDVVAVASRSAHVLSSLAVSRLGLIAGHLESVPGIADKLVAHIATPNVIELVAKLVTCDDNDQVADVCVTTKNTPHIAVAAA